MNIKNNIILLIACTIFFGCESPAPESNTREIDSLIMVLRDQTATDDVKRETGDKIEAYGKEAIPILIKNIDDKTICLQKCKIRSLPDHPRPGMKTTYSMPLGVYCQCLLESIITHPDDPTYTRAKDMPYMSSVNDWNNWWQLNQHKTLKQIQKEVMEYNIKVLDEEEKKFR